MKRLLLILVICLCGGCVATKMDSGTKALMAMKMQNSEEKETRITIEVMSKDGKKYPLEVIKDNGKFIIPLDKVIIRYELKID